MVRVPQSVGCDGRVVRDLLRDEVCGASCRVGEMALKELAEDGVERFAPFAVQVSAVVVLLSQRAEVPAQHINGASEWVGGSGGFDETGRLFSPVRGILGERGGGEDKGWRGEGGEVAFERCDVLV